MGVTIGGILGALVAGWLAGRAHLRATELKALDALLRLPAGTIEAQVNAATEQGAATLGGAAGSAADRVLGGIDGNGQ